MKLLRKVHLYIGLCLGLVFLVMAVSGTALVFRNDIISLFMDDAPRYIKLSPEQEITAIENLPQETVRFVDFPSRSEPWFELWFHNGDIEYYDPISIKEITVHLSMTEVMIFLADLHIYFLSGETGELISGYFGLILVFMIISGIWLWWPGRRQFRLKNILPRSNKRGVLLKSHRSFGFISSVLLLVVVSSGAGMVFYEMSQKTIALFTGEEIGKVLDRPTSTLEDVEITNFRDFTTNFHQFGPDGEFTRFNPPTREAPNKIRMRYRYPEDWTPAGASFITVDFAKKRITDFRDYRLDPKYNRISRKIYPVHSGKMDNVFYKILVGFSGVALLLMIYTGFAAWYRGRRNKSRH